MEIANILPLIIMFGAFYFLMIRPQMTKQKKEKSFQQSLRKGMQVVTTSGLHGRIGELSENWVILETLAGKLKFERNAISQDLSQNRYPATSENIEKA